MIEPYFRTSDGRALVYHCKAEVLLATLPNNSIDLALADPPYDKNTHDKAKTNAKSAKAKDGKLIDFDFIRDEDLRVILNETARVMKRWFVATMDDNHAHSFKLNPPNNMKFIRKGIWVKPDGMPQRTGDRPAQGWEAIVFAHKAGQKLLWSGGGRSSVFICGVERNALYKTQKPLPLIREFIELFSDPGDTVFDPFCGGGTTAVAAYERGRCVITCDPSEKAVRIAAERLREVGRRGDLLPVITDTTIKKSRRVKVEQGKLFTDEAS